jgi:hypothetical protein
MNESAPSAPAPSDKAAGVESDLERSAARDATWQAPWLATPDHPQGAADLAPPPQRATGHYGAGYDDPTRHFGNTLPGQPDPVGERRPDAAAQPEARDDADVPGTAARAVRPDRPEPTERADPVEPTERAERAVRAVGAEPAGPTDAEGAAATPLHSEDVGFRPPDRLPENAAPASENAGLIFERS